jgi:hypothetical protein
MNGPNAAAAQGMPGRRRLWVRLPTVAAVATVWGLVSRLVARRAALVEPRKARSARARRHRPVPPPSHLMVRYGYRPGPPDDRH